MSTTDFHELFEQARKRSNPFGLKPIITANEVWGEVMTNLPSLNQHIDEKILEAIFEVNKKYSNKIGITIKGDRGTGKSHIIHRIWKKIAQEGGAIFAYIGSNSNPKRINSQVRSELADSFNNQDIQGVTQWQKIAVAAIKTLKGTEFEDKYRPYIEKCDSPNELRKYIIDSQTKDTQPIFFDELAEAILENQSGIDFSFLKAILFLILRSVKNAKISFAWIKGEDHPEIKTIGLPEFSTEEQEDKSIWIIQQICKLAAIESLPVIICFDQIETGANCIYSGDSSAQIIAKCIDKIYFHCSNVILICCILSDKWIQIEQMGGGIPDRVGQRSVMAKPPNAEQMVQLVKLRLDWFYNNNNLNCHNYPDLYPFDESKIRNIASQSAGVRSLMTWCAEEFDKDKVPPVDPVNLVNLVNPVNPVDPDKKDKINLLETYQQLLKQIRVPIKDDDKLAVIISRTMNMIPDGGTVNVVITEVRKIDYGTHDLHFVIFGYDCLNQRDVKIGVRVCETTNAHTFNAVIKRLIDYDKHGITRGCLVRSTSIPINWKVGNQLKDQLEKTQKGEVVVLKKDDIKPLVVIEKIYEEAENYGFSREKVTKLVKELRLVADNELICEILSAPL